MAESASVSKEAVNLWDSGHSKDGDELICDHPTYHDMLIKNLTTLSQELKLTDVFWSLLLQRDVIDKKTKAKIQVKKTEQARVLSLMPHIMDLEVYKLHGFVWALVNSHQHQLAELLGFTVLDYLDMELFMKHSTFRCPACREFFTKAYILTGCGHYICAPCVKGAQFICKEDLKEDITCPVPDCNQVTKASPKEGSIGLDEDTAFKDLCQALIKELVEETGCSDCHMMIPALAVRHRCSNCDTVLCADCTSKHKKDQGPHHILHHHLTEQCCMHGRNTEAYCEQCDVYHCDQCPKGTCGHDLEKGKKRKEMAKGKAETLREYTAKLNDDVSSLKKHRQTLDQHEDDINRYIKEEQRRIKQLVDDWARENLEKYSSLQQQVEMRLSQSLQWQRAASELSIHLMTRPWLCDLGKDVKEILKKNAGFISEDVNLITQLQSGCSIPALMTPLPIVMRNPGQDASGHKQAITMGAKPKSVLGQEEPRLAKPEPPSKGGNMALNTTPRRPVSVNSRKRRTPMNTTIIYEWRERSDNSKIACRSVAATPDGAFLILTNEGVWRMIANEKNTSISGYSLIHRVEGATDIAVAEDSIWIVCLPDTIQIQDSSPEKHKNWKPENVRPIRVAINNACIFILDEVSKSIRIYSRDLEYISQYDPGPSYDPIGQIHVTKRGKLLVSSPSESLIYMFDLETKQVTYCSSTGNEYFGCVCSVSGDEYVLVGVGCKKDIRVFSNLGYPVRTISLRYVSNSRYVYVDPFCLACSPREGKSTLLAVCCTIDDKNAFRVYELK